MVVQKRGLIYLGMALVWLAMLLSQALAQDEDERPKVSAPEVRLTVTGNLVKMTAIGGETSGWAVVLDNPRQLGGKMIKRFELDPAGRKLDKFKDKHLEITGLLQTRTGDERGRYRVLVVKNILVLSN